MNKNASDIINAEKRDINKLLKKAVFVQNPLSEEFFNDYQHDDTDFKKAYNSDKTKMFYNYLYWKCKYNENINLQMYGTTRGGKTSAGIKIALLLSKIHNVEFPLNADYIFPNQSQFLRYFPKCQTKRTYVIDEQKLKRTQLGSFSEDAELTDINKISAKKMFNQIWISPDLVDRGGEYALKTIALDRELALTKCLIADLRNMEDGFFKFFGTVIIRHYDIDVLKISPEELKQIPNKKLNEMQILRKNYENKKDIGILSVVNRLSSERATYRLIDAYKLSHDTLYQKAKNITEKTIIARVTFPEGYTEDELEEIVRLARNKDILREIMIRKKIKIPDIKNETVTLEDF